MVHYVGLLPAKLPMAENVAQNGQRLGPLVAVGRKQIVRLKGFHTPLESWGAKAGNLYPF